MDILCLRSALRPGRPLEKMIEPRVCGVPLWTEKRLTDLLIAVSQNQAERPWAGTITVGK